MWGRKLGGVGNMGIDFVEFRSTAQHDKQSQQPESCLSIRQGYLYPDGLSQDLPDTYQLVS
jgi:hypothetical protein